MSLNKLNNTNKIKILDGSFGYQLSKHMEKSIDGDALWSARALFTNPEAIIKVHEDYIQAGSNIIETNSYQASVPGFVKYLGLNEEDSFNLIKKAPELAREAINRCLTRGTIEENNAPLVAGSIGPYGAFLHDCSEYSGNYTEKVTHAELVNFHKPRIEALIAGGVDLLAIETIPSHKEVIAILEILKEYPQMKAWVSFSCKTDGISTVFGDNFKEVAIKVYESNTNQIIAVGVNCICPSAVESLFKGINENRSQKIPLIVYANSGEKYDPSAGWDNNCEKLESYIPKWLDLGAKYIGGCCRVCSNYITKIREEVELWEKRQHN